MDTNTVNIEIQVTEDFLKLIDRAAAALDLLPETFVLGASVAAAIRLLSGQTHFPSAEDE
jgi:uncharacterized protein (DUF1778 family)